MKVKNKYITREPTYGTFEGADDDEDGNLAGVHVLGTTSTGIN